MQRRAFLLSGLSLVAGCKARPAEPPPPAPAAPALHLEPLTGLFAGAGLSWLIEARPRELLSDEAFAREVELVAPSKNLAAVSEHLGFDPRQASELVAAAYGDTSLWALRVPHDRAAVEARALQRLTGKVEATSPSPGIRVISGRLGIMRRAVALLEPDVVLIEAGREGPLKAALAFARGLLKKARPALETEPYATLARRLGPAPFRLVGRVPEGEVAKGARGLLEKTAAVGATAAASGKALAARCVLLGGFDNPPTEALRRLEAVVGDLTSSELGRLLGLHEPLSPPALRGDQDALTVEARLDAHKLAAGLRAATSAELSELFSGEGAPPAKPPPGR